MTEQVLTVSQFSELVNQTLEYAYPEVVIEGEVSSFKINQNKWVFFDLKDETSTVSCFMSIYQLKLPLEDGMLVRVHAKPKLTQWGKFSITILSVELSGEGSVKKAFDLLKSKLEQEGIFNLDRKRLLPKFPKRIALVTSRQAAAFNDFIKILSDRWSGLTIDHYQVQVQGDAAVDQIVEAIEYFNNESEKYDALILIRGGGSLEDLQVFQTEPVVRAVFASIIPTLVAIGHEDDVSLAELAADVRAATPTDAARLLVPDKNEFLEEISSAIYIHSELVNRLIMQWKEILIRFNHATTLMLASIKSDINSYIGRMDDSVDRIISKNRSGFEFLNAKLISLSPEAVLKRGYAVVRDSGSVIKSYSDVKIDDELTVKLSEGNLDVKVIEKYK